MLNSDTIDSVKKLATKYALEQAKVLAVVDVESGGEPFWFIGGQPMPPIRFEGHYFYARLTEPTRSKAVSLGLASPKVGVVKNPTSYARRYDLLDRAKALNEDAALESTSWGLGQVMGANWKDLGYKSVQDLVKATNTIDGQIQMLLEFVHANDLTEDLIAGNWKAFAKKYNGKLYSRNQYDKKLQQAYEKYATIGPGLDEITQLQTMLNSVGGYNLKVDGDYGVSTKASLRDFQLKNGLVVDGIYGPISREMLQAAYLAKSKASTQATGVGTTVGGAAATAAAEAAKQITAIAGASHILQYVAVAIIVLGVVITIYGLMKK